jgi:molybdate transport system regulatory protein
MTGNGEPMRLTLRIDFDDRQIGPGKVRLLELIDAHGSITASGKMMGMSYRRAWLLIDELNRMFEQPLVETRPGGRGGGNARLSVLGRAVVQLYRSIEQDCYSTSQARLAELERHLSRGAAISTIKGPAPAKKKGRAAARA